MLIVKECLTFLQGMSDDLIEFPWESGFQFRCRVDKIHEHTPVMGRERAETLANVWANFHFIG